MLTQNDYRTTPTNQVELDMLCAHRELLHRRYNRVCQLLELAAMYKREALHDLELARAVRLLPMPGDTRATWHAYAERSISNLQSTLYCYQRAEEEAEQYDRIADIHFWNCNNCSHNGCLTMFDVECCNNCNKWSSFCPMQMGMSELLIADQIEEVMSR